MSILAAYAVPHPPLIIPTVGKGEERRIQATIDAYRKTARQIAQLQPETIIVTSPHAPMYRDGFYVCASEHARGDMGMFRAPRTVVACDYDRQFAGHLCSLAAPTGLVLADGGEDDAVIDHATFIPLWFVERAYEEAGVEPDFKLLRIGISGLSYNQHHLMGELIAQAADDLGRSCVFVASGDLSHVLKADGPYGFKPEGPEFDAEIERIFTEGDLAALFKFDRDFCDRAAECGLRSFQMMAAALGSGWDCNLLSHEGPFGVGYAVAELHPHVEAESVDPYVALARAGVEHFVNTGEPLPLPDGLPAEMLERQAGAFVSLHKHGELRGCIGTIAPTCEHVAAEIIAMSVCACSEDPRFKPVRPDELASLEISVDVLGEAEDIASPDELDPQRYGVIVTRGFRRGLLLPALEGVDTIEEQIAIARRKAGIGANEPVTLQRFEVVRHDRGGEAPNAC